MEYFVKWCNLGDDRNTWENGEHIDHQLIQEYEDSCRRIERNRFVRELIPTKIVGLTLAPRQASRDGGQLMCLVESDNKERKWVTAEAAQEICPQILLKYYEKNIEWQ